MSADGRLIWRENNMEIIKRLVDPSMYDIKCPFTMTPEFYVVHNTANDAPAVNEIAYMRSNDKYASFHYAIDDKCVVQGIPENRNAYHAGDGSYGDGNRCGIAIEICYSASGGERFLKAERNAAEFIACGLYARGWTIKRVTKHQDYDGKYCPHRTLDMGWKRFLDMVQAELDKLEKEDEEMSKYFKDVPADAWYADEVDYCKEHGLMVGVSAEVFAPDQKVTRAQLATALSRLHKALTGE